MGIGKKFAIGMIGALIISTTAVAATTNLPSDIEGWMQPTYEAVYSHRLMWPFSDGKMHLDWNVSRYQLMFALGNLQKEIDQLQQSSQSSIDQATVNLAYKVMASTGQVLVDQGASDGSMSLGTGFFVKDNQHVLTDMHVIDENANGLFETYQHPKSITFVLGGQKYNASIESYAVRRDLCLLKLDKPVSGVTPLKIATSNPSIGQSVIAVGSPLGQYNSVTKGIVSKVWDDPYKSVWDIQIDAAINPGNSGGPVVTYDGKVVGIADFTFVNNNDVADGMGNATSWKEINAFLAGKSDELSPNPQY